LLNKSRLAYLARTGHDLQKAARLGENGALRALIIGLLFTHDTEYFYSMS
jgi:hypothetical protein